MTPDAPRTEGDVSSPSDANNSPPVKDETLQPAGGNPAPSPDAATPPRDDGNPPPPPPGGANPPPAADDGTLPPVGPAKLGPKEVQNFVFKRDLDQIYLLLDHISMSVTKSLPDCTSGSMDGKPGGLIEKIFKIRYPPHGSEADQADQAATLVCALDALNRAAAPANGMTIAFTLLVAGEDTDKKAKAKDEKAASEAPMRPDKKAPPEAPTRIELATGAFPTLVSPANRFKLFNTLMICSLVGFFFITCVLSWNVATGNAILGQVTVLKTASTNIAKQIAAAEVADNAPKTGAAGGGEIVKQVANTGAAPGGAASGGGGDDGTPNVRLGHYCDQSTPQAKTGKQVEALDSVSGIPLCDRKGEVDLQLISARSNLRGWLRVRPLVSRLIAVGSPAKPVQPGPSTLAAASDPDVAAKQSNEVEEQWAAALLQILGGAVLPIFYGLLGAGAAVVRGISARIRESVLAPRDLMLSCVQLVLGAVIGGCIGLFITPAGTGQQGTSGLLGSVQLSASALCFIAGFGVEGVFVALETLITRIFNIPGPSGSAAAGTAK